jgi:hypothetical protein
MSAKYRFDFAEEAWKAAEETGTGEDLLEQIVINAEDMPPLGLYEYTKDKWYWTTIGPSFMEAKPKYVLEEYTVEWEWV